MCEKVKWTSENEKRLHEQAHLGLKDVPLAQDSSYNKQSNDSDSNICSVLLQIYNKGKAIPVPGDNKQHALVVMLLPGTGPGFGLTVYL